jgi:RNA polymerase sigma-54 factor
MSLDLKQQLQPALQVKVTPKQIAANYILQMSSVELQEAISQELDENPALEMTELSTCPICGSQITGNYCLECMPRKDGNDGQAQPTVDDLPSDGPQRLRDETEDLDPIARAEAEFTLEEHLTWNLHALLPTHLHPVGDYIVGALDENGFLTETDAELTAATGASHDEIEQVLSAMRGLEPIGIGSRSITESLLAQIAHLRETDDAVEVPRIAEDVVRDHLQQLGERKFREIAVAL